jgi:hypothetical protein
MSKPTPLSHTLMIADRSARELPGVGQQVLERDAEQGGVADHGQAVGDAGGDTTGRLGAGEIREDAASEGREVDRAGLQRAASHARQADQGLDALLGGASRLPDATHELVGLGRQALPEVLDQRLRVPLDGAQRRPKVMRDRLRERLDGRLCGERVIRVDQRSSGQRRTDGDALPGRGGRRHGRVSPTLSASTCPGCSEDVSQPG